MISYPGLIAPSPVSLCAGLSVLLHPPGRPFALAGHTSSNDLHGSTVVILHLSLSLFKCHLLREASSVIPCHSLSHYSVYVLQSSFEMHGNLWFTYSLEQKLCESSAFLCLVHCHNCMSWNKAGTKGAE